jgi:hypothetical protein
VGVPVRSVVHDHGILTAYLLPEFHENRNPQRHWQMNGFAMTRGHLPGVSKSENSGQEYRLYGKP